MEIFRNVEPVLMLCFGLLCAAVALAYRPHTPAAIETAEPASWLTTHVVVIRAKRLSPAEKAEIRG